jgi:hypothetical protein
MTGMYILLSYGVLPSVSKICNLQMSKDNSHMYCFVLVGALGQLFTVYTIYQIQKSDDIDTADDDISTMSSTSNLSDESTIDL